LITTETEFNEETSKVSKAKELEKFIVSEAFILDSIKNNEKLDEGKYGFEEEKEDEEEDDDDDEEDEEKELKNVYKNYEKRIKEYKIIKNITKFEMKTIENNTIGKFFINDIWKTIVEFFTIEDIFRFRLVSKEFSNILLDEQLWKNICLKEIKSLIFIPKELNEDKFNILKMNWVDYYLNNIHPLKCDYLKIENFKIKTNNLHVNNNRYQLGIYI
jgi:hypothetical protein